METQANILRNANCDMLLYITVLGGLKALLVNVEGRRAQASLAIPACLSSESGEQEYTEKMCISKTVQIHLVPEFKERRVPVRFDG